VSGIEDLAYLTLDLAEAFELQDAVIVGNSFGGWVAAEMLVRDCSRFGACVLADPLGCKFGGRAERDITDMHALDHQSLMARLWANPARGEMDYTAKPESELAEIVQGREALALFGWKPYMHNPHLKHWLHRIKTPTLVIWGKQDGIIARAYAEKWVEALPDARLATIQDAGHYPHWEQPEAFADHVTGFAKP